MRLWDRSNTSMAAAKHASSSFSRVTRCSTRPITRDSTLPRGRVRARARAALMEIFENSELIGLRSTSRASAYRVEHLRPPRRRVLLLLEYPSRPSVSGALLDRTTRGGADRHLSDGMSCFSRAVRALRTLASRPRPVLIYIHKEAVLTTSSAATPPATTHVLRHSHPVPMKQAGRSLTRCSRAAIHCIPSSSSYRR